MAMTFALVSEAKESSSLQASIPSAGMVSARRAAMAADWSGLLSWAWRVAVGGRLSALAFGGGRSRARAVYLLVLVADVPGGDDYAGSDDCNSHGG